MGTLFLHTELSNLILCVKTASEKYGLYLNVKKTKAVICDKDGNDQQLKVANDNIEYVDKFNFLGSLILKEGGSAGEIKRRLAMARTSATALSISGKIEESPKQPRFALWRHLSFRLPHMAQRHGQLE